MKTLKLTAKDFKQSSSFWKDYIGEEDVSDFQGHIEKCGKLEKGKVCYGTLRELGMPEEKKAESLSGKTVSVTLGGQTYEAVIK